MIRQIWGQITHFFAPMWEVLPQICVLASLVGFSLSKEGPPDVQAVLSKFDHAFLAILGGGFFAWLTKTRLFREAIRDELTAIIYDPKHLKQRKDVPVLWRNATVAAGLPEELSVLAGSDLLRSIWNPLHPYYYVDLHRSHRLRWDDSNPGLLRVESQVEGLLRCATPGVSFCKSAKLEVEDATYAPVTKYSQLTCKQTKKVFSAPFKQDPAGPLKFLSEVTLPGGAEYRMDEVWQFGQLASHDNVIMFQSRVFVRDLTVTVEYDPRTMNVLHKDIGVIELLPAPHISTAERVSMKLRCEGLVPPWSGYILSIQRI